jgi:hypothetical protein
MRVEIRFNRLSILNTFNSLLFGIPTTAEIKKQGLRVSSVATKFVQELQIKILVMNKCKNVIY